MGLGDAAQECCGSLSESSKGQQRFGVCSRNRVCFVYGQQMLAANFQVMQGRHVLNGKNMILGAVLKAIWYKQASQPAMNKQQRSQYRETVFTHFTTNVRLAVCFYDQFEQVEKVLLWSQVVECFYHETLLDFVQCLFCIQGDNHVILSYIL